MAKILKGISNYIPVNMAVNFIFKQALSKYVIIDEDNVNNIDKANQDNSFIILRNLKVNASEINSTHLKHSPMKIITGEIDLISFSFQSNKLTLKVSGVNIQLMPLFEKQQQKEVQKEKVPKNDTQQQKVKKEEVSKNDTQQQTKSSGGFINTFVNFLLGQVEIIIEHVCFKVLTYDVKDPTLTYPSVGLFLSKIAIVKNNKSKPEINIEDNDINNENKKVLFLYGFNISVWNFCIKACENHTDEEKEFLNISKNIKEYNDNDPSFIQMKQFFTKECTILALDNSKGASIDIDIPHKPSNSNNDDLDVNITINSIEIMLYPYQLHNLMMFSKVCALIYNSPSSPPSPKEEPQPQPPQQPAQSTKAKLNFLGFDISGLNVNLNMKGLNFVLYETMNNDITYKRLYFYNSKPYKEGSDLTGEGSPVHKYYCYYNRNYYLFSINAITVHFQTNFEEDKSSLKVKVLGIKLTYINFLRREEAQKEVPSNNIKISIFESCSSITNSAMFVSALGVRPMDQEPLPNTNDLNEQVYFDEFSILHVDEVHITQSNNAELNVGVGDVVLSLHLVVFFPLINLLYSNILFPQQIRTIFNEEEYDQKHPYKPPQEVQSQTETTLNLNPPEISKAKANNRNINNNSKISTVTVHVHVDNVYMFVYPVKRDYQRIDGNEFFYQYYSHYILPFLSQPNGVVFHQNIIERTKSPSCIIVNIPDINVNIMSNNTINLTIADLILQYNSCKIIHLQKHSGTPTAFTLDLHTPNTTAVSLSLTQEVIVNVTPFIINELLMFMDNFFVGMNILQIYMNFQQKIYNDKTDELFVLYDIKQFIDKEPSSPTTNSTANVPTLLAVDGCIKTLTLNVNANDKANSQEDSLIRIVVNETKLEVQMKSDEEMKGVSVDVGSFKLGIKKNNLQNSIINNAEQGNYCWIITTLIENNTPFIHLDFKFGTLFKKRDYRGKEIIELLQQSSNGSISNNSSNVSPNDSSVFHNKEYETFLLTHQLPMDSMKTIIDLTINNIYIESFYSQVNDISPSLNTLILAFTKQNKPLIVPLIPLAESSEMIMNLNFKLSKLYIDVFDKGNHDCLVQNFSRALLIIEGLKVFVNPTAISLSLSNMYIFILNNFQFTHKNITNQNELFSPKQHIFSIQKNDSYLRRIGYMELFRLSTVKLQFSPKEELSKKTSTLISIDNIEFSTCEDGIYCVKLIVEFVSTQMNNMVNNILPTITESTNNSTNEFNKTSNNSSQNASSLNVSTPSSKEFIIQQDYFKVNKSNDSQILNTSTITVNTIDINNNEEGNNKEQLDENEIKVSLNFLKFTLYEGRDFDFDSQNNDITNIPLDKKVEPKKQTNSVFQIDNDYFKKKKTQSTNNKELTERARYSKRKICNNISFILTKLQTNIVQNENQTDTISLEVQIDNLEIQDNIPKSKYSKLFSRYYYNKQDTFLLLKLSSSTFEKKTYISLDFSLTPINILIDFNSLSFILKSITYNPSNIFEVVDFEDLSTINNKSNQKDFSNSKLMGEMLIEKQKQMSLNEQSQSQPQNEPSTQNNNINFTHIFIKEFFINVSFAHNYIFPNISDLQIRIKQYNFTGTDECQKQIETLMLLYIKSVLKQIPSVMFHSISLLRPLANIVDGAFDLVKQPYYSFKSGKGITRGIGKGVKRFFFGLTGETLFVFEKTAAIFQHAFFGRENKTMLGKNSYYKKWIYLGNKKRQQYEEYFHKK